MTTITLLNASDLVSGALCESYNVLVDKRSFSGMRFFEQVVYRVLGRMGDSMIPPIVTNQYVNDNDILTAGVSIADHKLRKNDSMNMSLGAGLRSGLSSAAADVIMHNLGGDKKIV
jgi:hypothetical protein